MKRLKVFGGVSIETEDGPLGGRATQKRRLALLALLAAARSHGTSRDRLIAFLWPDADAENGRRFLSDSVYRINDALGGDVIIAVGDELRLDAERLPSDLFDFADARARGDHEAAVAHYGGPFLDGFFLSDSREFERWVDGERDTLAREFAASVEALAEQAEGAGNASVAAGWWRRAAAHDPYNSRIALRLMQSLDASGERAAAIQHARIHETLLAEELEIEPDAAVKQFAEQLRGESRPAPVAQPRDRGKAGPSTSLGTTKVQPTERALSSSTPARERMESIPHIVAPAPTSHRRFAIASVLAAALLLAAGWMAFQRNRTSGGDSSQLRTIAVLPFTNIGGEKDNEYFSDGITEELISALGRVDGLQVASRTSVFALKDKSLDVRDVGKRLGVSAVVEGSVRKSGNRLRITSQLVSTDKGYDLWSEVYDRELSDVFSIQEEISSAIVKRLKGALAGGEPVKLAERKTTSLEAYDLYLKGRFAWHQRTRDGLREAVDYFSRAVVSAPDYARAYVGLADAYAVSAFYDYLPPRESYPKAEAAARRALELDPALAAPHATLGYVDTYYTLDWKRAEEEFKRALAADPNYSTAHQWYANLLTVSKRFDDAEREMRIAQEADPLSLVANAALGWILYHAGKLEAALEQERRALALNPDFELAHMWGGFALDELGRHREASEWIGNAVRLSHGSTLTRLALAHALARSGTRSGVDSARAIVSEIEALHARGEYVPSYEVGKVRFALGERDAALTWLRRAVEEKSHSRAFFGVDPQLASLRKDPRFAALLR